MSPSTPNRHRPGRNHASRLIIRWDCLVAGIGALVLMFSLNARAASAPGPIPSITIAGATYSNVVVQTTSETSVMIKHARGTISINRAKLTRQEEEDLGLVEKPPPPPPEPAETLPGRHLASVAEYRDAVMQRMKSSTNGPMLNLAELKKQVVEQVPSGVLTARVLAIPVAAYLALCICFLLICSKAGKPSKLLVWVPLVQVFPLYRAARMSPAWFIALLGYVLLPVGLFVVMLSRPVPLPILYGAVITFIVLALVHFIGGIVWCFKIAAARGKSAAVGLSLLLPGVNILALAYLALSPGAARTSEPSRPKPTTALRL